ncbi:hypothetical protein DMN91_002591 [Ooceraea biroi]|uniref:HTH CENPB-type domain-containing protein n=1 Tax=Ooceraea biroi TaxID=2015173 RepID=A0A3L8DW10_OOCBI|nr:uncharacterized protein LOC105280672 [Ooceraea biroi]XP_011339678.1 uncharacterized protein LOC105280672 [Ooceraea biroi]XP_011339679.1 uncharacterized protein LOC105280672 [Ooceraea biroi]RLU24502.1 hypothetical protein DMN91_002591 [Ooceraea biroi]
MEQTEKKSELTNARIYCYKFKSEGLIADRPPAEISVVSVPMGEELYKNMLDVLADNKIIIDEDTAFKTINEDKKYKECTENVENIAYNKLNKDKKYNKEKHGCSRLKSMKQLKQWTNTVKRGGTKLDKWRQMKMETFERVTEARKSSQQVTTRTIQEWAMSAASPFLSKTFVFYASKGWAKRFKLKYKVQTKSNDQSDDQSDE